MTNLRLTGLAEATMSWADLDVLDGRVDDAGTVAEGGVGTAVPVASILDEVRLDSGAAYCTVVSRDGSYRASIPIADLRSGGWLAYALGGVPLPEDHGGPLRLTVAQGSTQCWNVKDVGELRLTQEKEPDSVPGKPSH
jgi:DMSO/TMAO reductase YedYZ molybdopterin-dependent catalytic subunit